MLGKAVPPVAVVNQFKQHAEPPPLVPGVATKLANVAPLQNVWIAAAFGGVTKFTKAV